MNQVNQTIVSGEFYNRLREAGLDNDYEPLPSHFRKDAERALAGRHIVDMTPDMKRKLRNKRKAKHRAGVAGY